jgi:uncharacterized protein YkwD
MKTGCRWLFVLLALLVVAACGEDSGSDGYCAVTENWNGEYAEKESEMIDLVNGHRAAGADCGGEGMFEPAPALTLLPGLECAARVHSRDMVVREFFDHDNPDGDGPAERMIAAGVELRSWGENIAAGSSTAEAAMAQWMDSDGHCANFMNPNFRYIGIGYYPGGEWGHYWTATLMAGPPPSPR